MTGGHPYGHPDDPGLPPPLPPQGYPPATWAPYLPYPPYAGFPPHRPPGTNGMAIAALVSALAGLVFCGLPSVAGLILGVIAMRQTKRTGQDGYGLALAATIVGALATVVMVLGALLWIGLIAGSVALH
ncbi:DUF4190 domain-containing protein [Mycolicibacterium neoaurum]|uniref:DUF4190 domain-containing protein n=1 Tax=Mycolicibacterium neoaurum TaxID=1795 RepID=UPI002673E9E9|nr:DUF4190 domain-containing protein [Mycolicibacterium neoaurum]MDO3403210.1 DUF4190 domain-containing protein [Mycolicibacterium neoaurum]